MLMSPYFEGKVVEGQDLVLQRQGVVSSVVVPSSVLGRMAFDVNIESDQKSVVFCEGQSIHILADEFGIVGSKDNPTEANIFFVDGGMGIELVDGVIALKSPNGDVYLVDEQGDIDYPNGLTRIHWVNTKSMRESLGLVVKARYGLPDYNLTNDYTMNLLFGVRLHYFRDVSGYLFNIKTLDMYEDLGDGLFSFINYNAPEFADNSDDFADIADLKPVVDEEEEEEEEEIEYSLGMGY